LGGGGLRWGRVSPQILPLPLGRGRIGEVPHSLQGGGDSFRFLPSNSLFPSSPFPFPLFYMYNIFLSIDKNMLQSNEGKDIFFPNPSPPSFFFPKSSPSLWERRGLRWGRIGKAY